MQKTVVDGPTIESFLTGNDPQKYIVAVEGNYNTSTASIVVNDPETGKRIEVHPYKPFLWFKHEVTQLMYGGKKLLTLESCKQWGVTIKALKTSDESGFVPERMENGYRYIATCTQNYNSLVSFFREGGLDVFDKSISKMFMMFSPAEQFLIQSKKRLFKGMDDYNDIHRFQFDLETEGLNPSIHGIFQIGMRDNRGFEEILETTGATHQERRDTERLNIGKFFSVIDILRPDVITGYNSEDFDWDFLFKRCERYKIPITRLARTLDANQNIKRKASKIKFGGEMEDYMQTNMWGYNIIDIAHSVRRAQAINSDIQKWNLKYITQYSEIAKPNRIYILGDKLNSTWLDTNPYALNDINGHWYKISTDKPLKKGYEIVSGAYLVQRYLKDDLWETEAVDTIFNQATFLIAKMLPTTYQRSSTMGTAGQWKLIMAAWSYENKLAIPRTEPKREFTGGLSRLLSVGYSKGVDKFDYAALYPKTELTWDIFPDLDISGVMKGLLTYVVETRDKFKFLVEVEKNIIKGLKKDLQKEGLTAEEKTNLKVLIAEHNAQKNLYDKKQLPLKILANSWFGSYGAPYLFNWGDTNCAEETTCRGRQALRLMVKFFTNYGFKALVLDTDGANFKRPDNVNDIKYTANGSHWKTKDIAGQELTGVPAALAEFNETLMEGYMGLDLDDSYNATINFSRKNYANDLNGKIKLVGNSIKSKKMPTYIEEFLKKAIRLLLDGKGYEFIEYYYEYVNKIYNFNIPMVKIASKSKVTTSMSEYRKKATMKNKAGNPMPKQAHMELALRNNLNVSQGDVLYYVNTGKLKSHGDLKTIRDKETGAIEVQLNCKLLNTNMVESDTELIKELEHCIKTIPTLEAGDLEIQILEDRIHAIESGLETDEYNVAKYLSAFNKKLEPLMVVFNPDIRKKILISVKKDKTDKVEKLEERSVFTESQCLLISGQPLKDGQQDDYFEDLMKMEDKEIRFWERVNKLPNYMEQSEWDEVVADYQQRMIDEKIKGLADEKNKLEEIIKRIEIRELRRVKSDGALPSLIFVLGDIDTEGEPYLVSRKWNEKLCHIEDIFAHEQEAIQRDLFYQEQRLPDTFERYEKWLDHKAEQIIMTGITMDISTQELGVDDVDKYLELVTQAAKTVEVPVIVIEKKPKSEDDDEDDEPKPDVEEEDDFLPELELNAYLDEVPVHVHNRPNIKVYPVHIPIIETVLLEPVSDEIDEEDEWNF